MDYGLLMNGLVNEAKQSIQLKRMKKFPRFITRLLLLPFSVMALFTVLGYYITLFFYKAILAPVAHLEAIVKREREETGSGAQVIVYLFAFPLIFICHAVMSFVTVYFYFQWFFAMVWLYFATLHGIKWQPILTDASYDEEIEWELKTSDKKANKWAKGFFNRILVPLIIFAVAYVAGMAIDVPEIGIVGVVPLVICSIISVFSYIYGVFFGFRKTALEYEEFEELSE